MSSNADFNQFERQAKEAIAFLRQHGAETKRLCQYPGVESVGLDFGIAWRDVVAQFDCLPAELIRLAGELGLDIVLSRYPVAKSEKRSLTRRSSGCSPRSRRSSPQR